MTDIDDPKALGRRLVEARSAQGLSLRQLAFPGCTASYLSTIEHGRRVPSLQILSVLAQRLGVTVAYLARGDEGTPVAARLVDAEIALRLGRRREAARAFKSIAKDAEQGDLVRTLGGLGICRLQEGHLSKGIDLLEQARSVESGRFLAEPSLVEALGRAYATRSEFESATALFSDARSAATERGDRTTALRMTVLLANTYIDLGNTLGSNDELASALSDAVELRDPRVRARILWTQARLHTVEGRHDLAAEFAQRVLEILRVTEDERAIAFAEQTLAYIELERGNPERGLELLDAAAPTIDRIGEDFEKALLQLERARAFVLLSRDDEARSILTAIGPLLHAGPRGDGGRYYIVLAELYERLDQSQDALLMYDTAIEQLVDHRSPHLVRAFRMKSRLLERLGRSDEALAALRAAFAEHDGVRSEGRTSV